MAVSCRIFINVQSTFAKNHLHFYFLVSILNEFMLLVQIIVFLRKATEGMGSEINQNAELHVFIHFDGNCCVFA